jgi:prepilin-type N-terminal cleavage/methylation domain-containing protein
LFFKRRGRDINHEGHEEHEGERRGSAFMVQRFRGFSTQNAEPRTLNAKTLNGFSLLEMLVVLLIIAVTMGLFFGINFRQKESIIIRSFSSELSMFMAAARGQAILDGRENICVYHPQARLVSEELKHRSLAVPEEIELVFEDSETAEKHVLAIFYPDGSLVLEDFFVRSPEHKYLPEADPFMGRVRFEVR